MREIDFKFTSKPLVPWMGQAVFLPGQLGASEGLGSCWRSFSRVRRRRFADTLPVSEHVVDPSGQHCEFTPQFPDKQVDVVARGSQEAPVAPRLHTPSAEPVSPVVAAFRSLHQAVNAHNPSKHNRILRRSHLGRPREPPPRCKHPGSCRSGRR